LIPPFWQSPTTGSTVWQADARAVAATLPAGSVSCAILDGPYGMGKAAWDRIPRGGSLLDLYRDHLADVGRLCAASASLYVWNTAEGWGELHPAIIGMGWDFKTMIVWDKLVSPAIFNPYILWSNTAEFCAYYTRGEAFQNKQQAGPSVWQQSHTGYLHEKLQAQNRIQAGKYSRTALHPSQKPLLFADRMIRASTRPGDVVWVPFGGTLRELVAAEHIAQREPTEARKVWSCELNQDGVDYLTPAIEQATGRPLVPTQHKQPRLFG